jgi:hypothetical protein
MDGIVREAIEMLVFVSAGYGSLSSAPSKNLHDMTPDSLGYTGHTIGSTCFEATLSACWEQSLKFPPPHLRPLI